MARTTCRDCNRNIMMARVGGELVATDPELITVVPARNETRGDGEPRIRMAESSTFARRLHSERCSEYQEQARRERIAAEMREFTKKQSSPRRNRGL